MRFQLDRFCFGFLCSLALFFVSQQLGAQEPVVAGDQQSEAPNDQVNASPGNQALASDGEEGGKQDDYATLLPTVAESSNYTDTATDGQVEMFMRRLASVWPESELTTIGRTVEGRPMWALVVEPKQKPANDSRPVTVLVLGGIHSGECDGKEAVLALARDMADGKVDNGWQTLRLIFVPNFNADGNERRGKAHRPGQAGPDNGMGTRENAQGLDLNRDFIKLESPEVRGLVAAMNEYEVDVLIDTHTTNGSLHQYQLTYDVPHNPATPTSIKEWLRGNLLPSVTQRMTDSGFNTFYYGNYDRDHRRWSTYGHEPRYSTEYMGLRGKIGILSESYSYASYQTRVKVSYAFVREVLRGIAEDQAAVREMIDAAERPHTTGDKIALQGAIVKTADGVVTNGYQQKDGTPPRGPYSAASFDEHDKKDYTVQLWNRCEATKSVAMPAAYVIPRQYAWAVSKMMRHGVEVKKLKFDVRTQGEVYKITNLDKAPEFQGHEIQRAEVETQVQEVSLEAGSYVVETSQPLGVLASYLLEPEADDSLLAWNFLDPDIAEGKLYPISRLKTALPADNLDGLESVEASEQITLDRLMAPGKTVAYGGEAIRGANWLKGSSEYVVTSGSRTFAVEAATGSMRRLNELDSFRSKLASLEAFTDEEARSAARISAFTDDWAFALIAHKNDLYYFDAKSDTVRQLTHTPEAKEQLPELSPTGKHACFVRDNNIWVVDCESTEQKQLTSDGSVELLNGILDWVYQEELYGRGNFKAYWWSPDGSQVAFLQLDQTPVPSYQVSDSISFAQTLEATRYPKAGQPLPTVNVFLVDILSGEVQSVNLSDWAADDRLIGRVTWSPAGELWLQVFNRVQNQHDLVRVDASSGVTQTLFSEVTQGWVEIRGVPEFLPDGNFLWLSDLPDGRTHLFLVDSETGAKSQLTSGDWDISTLHSISTDGKTCFVSGNIGEPTGSHLVAVDLESGTVGQITTAPGTHRVAVNASGEYFIDVFSSLDSQPFASLNSIDGQMVRVVETQVSDRHEYLEIQPPKSFTITARDGLELQAQLLLPPGFDIEKPASRLPVLFHVYGGPQAPTVNNSWGGRNYWWHQMLCQQGFAVVLCDNRSARGRGVKDTWAIRGDLCRVELQDLEDAAKWVSDQPWADKERFGIWGWSYGGYFTAFTLTHSDTFKCGIAGAPVTDWRNYDAIYTERYMGLPQDNEAGYKSSSVVEAAANLSGRLMLLHGERDDNVHISNTLQLVYALQQAGKQFDLMVYPKNRHGIVNPAQRFHMHQLMTDFLKKHLLE